MTLPNKALFILLDALRYDVLEDPKAAAAMAPNIARLADRGIVRKCVANAQSTQFVLPCLFTQTYPLDHGGYNDGIRHRPKSMVELFKEAGYETHLMSSSNQVGITLGYDRGFDTIRTTTDYRTLLEQRISRTLSYEIGLWRKGKQTRSETIEKISPDLDLLLARLQDGISSHDKSLWPPALHKINALVAKGCAAERALLRDNPDAVLEKMDRIPAGVYWRFLGVERANPLLLFASRARAGVTHRLQRWAASRWWFPFILAGHYPVKTGEIVDGISDFVRGAVDKSWYIHMHAMDVHDCRYGDRLGHMIDRLMFLPRWWRARRDGLTRRRWSYDTAVMYFDREIGKLFDTLEKTGQMEKTVIVIAGDHGHEFALSPRGKKDVGMRTYREDLEAAMLIAGTDRAASSHDGLLDSMGVSASFMTACGVKPHASYKGVSVYDGGRDSIISESAGRGNADLARRDIYFTITTKQHKLMTMLAGSELRLIHLFDLSNDPDELTDLLPGNEHDDVVEALLGFLKRERSDLLEMRGALVGNASAPDETWKLSANA